MDWLTSAVFFAGLAGWVWLTSRWRRGLPVYPFQSRRPVPWGLLHVLVAVCIWFALQLLTYGVARAAGWISPESNVSALDVEHQMRVVTVSSMASLLATAVVGLFLRIVVRARAFDVGLDSRRIGQDMAVGIVAFAILFVPVVLIQSTLTRWYPTKHPLIEMLNQEATAWLLLQAGFSAIIVAPLFEEFFIRVLLQGWLENVAQVVRQRRSGWDDVRTARPEPGQFLVLGTQAASTALESGQPVHVVNSDALAVGASSPLSRPATWPIFVTSALFAVAHLGHGPDPIPLFVLALGLGYLYQRTHRILPCVVVHFLLNCITMLNLWQLVR